MYELLFVSFWALISAVHEPVSGRYSLLFYGHVLLLELIDLFTDQLGFLNLLLDYVARQQGAVSKSVHGGNGVLTLLLVAFVQSNLGVEFGSDLIQELVEARSRILRKPAVGIHRHVVGVATE